MGNIFAGSEIIEIGIQIEKNGKDFYQALANNSKNRKAQEIFKYLAGEEAKHIVVFEKILSSAQEYVPPEAYPGEYFVYMNALASEHIFTRKDQGKAIAAKIKTDLEAVDMGIRFEEDSIVFYEGMKKTVPEYDLKSVEALIVQEQDHLKKLIELKHSL